MSAFRDISGQKFGRLLVLRLAEIRGGRSRFLCLCDCGKEAVVMAQALKSGHTESCGCLYRESRRYCKKATHGMSHTREHESWSHMRRRCENPKDGAWALYGGRGITVCERWKKFENFYADMGACPEGHEIEREDVNGNYEPSNCRWASRKDQANNTRRNRIVVHEGKLLTIAQFAEATGINYSTAYWRHAVRGKAPTRGALLAEERAKNDGRRRA